VSIPYNLDIDAYVVPGGSITLRARFETYIGSGIEQPVSGTQITITPAAGGSPLVGPTPAGVVAVDQATYSYQWLPPASTPPGDYQVAWTATGPNGTLTISQAVNVAQPPQETPTPGAYATVAQYQNYTGDRLTPTWLVTIYLRRVSQETIDEALIGAVYPTDADSMPTVAEHIDVFMRATCAQVSWVVANNDIDNVKSQYASTSMGGVTQVLSAKAQSQVLPKLCPGAAAILHVASVLGTAALVNW
jgi:hypothetical protein